MHSNRRPDLLLASAGLVLGLAITSLNVVHTNEYLLTMGPLLTGACLIHILTAGKRPPSTAPLERPPTQSIHPVLPLTVPIIACNLVLVGSIAGILPLDPGVLFLLYAIASALTAALSTVASQAGKPLGALLIAQVLLLALVIRMSTYYQFPTIPGMDSASHGALIEQYLESGRIPVYYSALHHFNYYHSLPFAHTLGAAAQLASGLSTKSAMFVAWSAPQVFTSLAVFVVGRRLFGDSVGLLAMLLAATADYQIAWGAANLIAMTVGLGLFSIVVLLTLGRTRNSTTPDALLLLLLLFAIVFTHTVTYFITMTYLAVLVITPHIYRMLYLRHADVVRTVSPVLLAVAAALILVHSRYLFRLPAQASFFERQLAYWLDSISEKASLLERGVEASGLAGMCGAILNVGGQLAFLGLGALGCLLLAQPETPTVRRFSFIPLLFVMIGLPLLFPLFGIANIQPTRWPAFYYILLAIPASAALLTYTAHCRHATWRAFMLFATTATLVFLMSTNSVSNPGYPLYSRAANEPTVYSRAEDAVATFLERITVTIVTDGRYHRYLRDTHSLDVSFSRKMMAPGDAPHVLLWRARLEGRPVQVVSGDGDAQRVELVVLPRHFITQQTALHVEVYSSRDVTALLAI